MNFGVDDKHRYFLDGNQIPGVTEILSSLHLSDFSAPWFTKESRDKGSHFHECCELINQDALDWDSVFPEVLEEVEKYSFWKDQSGFIATETEIMLCSKKGAYAGAMDVVGYFSAKPNEIVLIDLKRGAGGKSVQFQLALYEALQFDNGVKIDRVASLEQFSSKGPPKFIEYTNQQNLENAKSILKTFYMGLEAGIYSLRCQEKIRKLRNKTSGIAPIEVGSKEWLAAIS